MAFLSEEIDKKYMRRALTLALKGRGYTRPNPIVGAVLVKDDRIIGEGWHKKFGDSHAEVNAFTSALEDPTGATLYITLEPCSHYGKTPPCADLIIKKKVARVVCAMQDPNPVVSGRGLELLQSHGISVTVGILEKEAKKVNDIFLKYIVYQTPFVLYKAAMSLDGKIACYTGDSRWVSSEESRKDVHKLRSVYTGIMVGAGTIIADNPRLTARIEGAINPIRIIVDGNLSIPTTARVFKEKGRNIILTTSDASNSKKNEFENLGAEIFCYDSSFIGKVDLKKAMIGLGSLGIDSILLEGGPTLATEALKAGIIDKVRFYYAPKIIGGNQAISSFVGKGVPTMDKSLLLNDGSYETLGEDFVIEAYLRKPYKLDALN